MLLMIVKMVLLSAVVVGLLHRALHVHLSDGE